MDDTICAIATPCGEGGIGIIRVSGEKAVEIASGVIRLTSGRSLSEVSSHVMHHADIVGLLFDNSLSPGSGSISIDKALVVVMRVPHSYTGEDVVEIHCHGGPFILQSLCEILVAKGARLAQPGEFTKRAFLNGKLDLTQAEAVLDTIRAKTAASLRLAQEQLRGALSKEMDRIRQRLIHLLAHVEAAIDFTEEGITFIQEQELLHGIESTIKELSRLTASYQEGQVLREGVTAAIVGRPNVGKSSLLNALLRTDRAIVTPVPGTTRDVLEETLNIRGVPVRLWDTAGMRETMDLVEQEGVRRSRAAMEQADLLLVLLDGSVPLTPEDRILVSPDRDKKIVLVINKTDLLRDLSPEDLHDLEHTVSADATVWISAKTGAGLDDLRDAIRNMVLRPGFEAGETAMATNLRHRTGLVKASEALHRSVESISGRLSSEFVALDLRGALDALGEITGVTTTDDILDHVFSQFCVGK
ncbi:MAG TPA: tRNA uridine-5-carboxymethylaminomethyl(34) synthesis GTPase MnmE [Nitrospiraceae bacterium]|nr:tRNA uridine-5-carboxymethylaminomethyl(34) synthesis GTPase MnmE [Nitrospiraceae bacterium]